MKVGKPWLLPLMAILEETRVPPQGAVLEWAAEPAGAKVLGPCTLVLTLRPGEPGTQPDL